MWTRRKVLGAGTSVAALYGLGSTAFAQAQTQTVEVDLSHQIGPLEHIWSRCVGSDRAEITLRESWRHDAQRAQREIGIERVRFHGIFNDELGMGAKSFVPTAGFNFQNVDAVYDGLLELGLRPFVELSFMPAKLASGTQAFGFYHANVTPPQSMSDWQSLVEEFARHLLARYGPAEVRQWYFEVWNEPNLSPFWSGTQAQYFDLYRAAAMALKSADAALKVGGPATSSAQWIPAFLDYCAQSNTPLDFVSTHLYAGDNQAHIFGESGKYPGQREDDTMHLIRSGSTAADIAALDPDLIGYIQICDAPMKPRFESYFEESMFERIVPGEGELGLQALVDALPHDRVFAVEVPLRSEAQAGIGPHERLAKCIKATRRLLDQSAKNRAR